MSTMSARALGAALLAVNTVAFATQPTPRLVPRDDKPLTLAWVNVTLEDGCWMISSLTGVRIRFAENVDPALPLTVTLTQRSLDDVLAELMRLTKLSYRVLDATTIVVFVGER